MMSLYDTKIIKYTICKHPLGEVKFDAEIIC